jgi:hypothetical protein
VKGVSEWVERLRPRSSCGWVGPPVALGVGVCVGLRVSRVCVWRVGGRARSGEQLAIEAA